MNKLDKEYQILNILRDDKSIRITHANEGSVCNHNPCCLDTVISITDIGMTTKYGNKKLDKCLEIIRESENTI